MPQTLFSCGRSRHLQPLQLAVDERELRLRLLVLQVLIPVLFRDQRLDLTSKKPQEGGPVDGVAAVLELAGPDRLDDLILRQPELRSCRLVAERMP